MLQKKGSCAIVGLSSVKTKKGNALAAIGTKSELLLNDDMSLVHLEEQAPCVLLLKIVQVTLVY